MLATFEWHTPPPTSVDEELALYDDGSAVLVVRQPRRPTATVGSYVAHPGADDARLLAAAGPGPVVFDLLAPATDAATEATGGLMAAADRVAADSLATPRAVVTFHAHVANPPRVARWARRCWRSPRARARRVRAGPASVLGALPRHRRSAAVVA